MVNSAFLRRAVSRAWSAVQHDVGGLIDAIAPRPQQPPQLYTYRISLPGGSRRLHLRMEAGGGGLLFVDAMDVIHLNATAALLAKLALDETHFVRACRIVRHRFRGAGLRRVRREARRVYRLIDHLRSSENGCLTCGFSDWERRPLFGTRAQAPYKADLALTYGCNNSCSHCYNETDRFAMSSLPARDWFRVLEKLAGVGVPHVIFTGGEATLHPDLPEIIDHAERLGQITGLNTNGRRIAYRPYMQSLAAAGLNHLQVTLASHRAAVHNAINGADAFHQTVRGIENALDSGVHTITNTTLMRANADQIEPLINFLYGLGIRTFAMNGMIYSGGGFRDPNALGEDEVSPLLLAIRDQAAELGMRFLWYTPTEYCRMSPVELEIGAKRCNAGEYSVCVEPNGDVLPCQSYYVRAGNILQDPWDVIWNGGLFRSFRDRELDPRWAGLPEKCWDCPDLPLCGGGCRIERAQRDGRRIAGEEEGGGCCGCSSGGCSSGGCSSGGCSSGGCSSGGPESAAAPAGFVPLGKLAESAVRGSGRGADERKSVAAGFPRTAPEVGVTPSPPA